MGLRRAIQRNFWAKFLSFVLAFMTWLSIRTGQSDDSRTGEDEKITVSEEPASPLPNLLTPAKPKPANAIVKSKPVTRPVALLKPPSDSYAYEVKPTEVEIVLQGEKEQLDGMDATKVQVFADITEVLEKFNTAEQHAGIPVRIEVHTPLSVTPASITPALATVKRIPPPEPPKKADPKPKETIKPDENLSTNKTGLITVATNAADRASAPTNAPSQSDQPAAQKAPAPAPSGDGSLPDNE